MAAAGFCKVSGGARTTPLATVKAISASAAAKAPAVAREGAKAAVLAASISRPILSAWPMMAGSASGFRPAMVSPFVAAVPEPESDAIMESTDLPLLDRAADAVTEPVRPASGSAVAMSAPVRENWPLNRPVPSLFFRSNRPAKAPPNSVAFMSETCTPCASSARCRAAS